MTESRAASDGDPATAGVPWWAATWRWLEVLNTFLERAYQQADVDTGC
jgi:hypothetical protein